MEGRELQFWTCEYPVQTEEIISNCEESKGLNKNVYQPIMYGVFYYLHTHWAVLPGHIFNTLKHGEITVNKSYDDSTDK